jgi:TRAP-type transport system periplasmic protein
MNYKNITHAAIIAGLTWALSPALVSAKTFVMKTGFATINDSQHKSAIWMKKELARTTGGRIDLKIFPLSQLGKIPRQIEGIQLGTQEAFITPPGFFVGINPAFQVADAPALFDDMLHQVRALNHPSVREKFLGLAERAGVIGNYIWCAGDTSFATSKPFKTLADLKGRKIRVLASKIEVALMKEFGASGIPMPFTEVLPAIQRHVVDGVRSGIIVMGPMKFYTAAKNLTLTGQGYIPSAMWLSKVWLNKLPADLQQAIFAAGKKVTPLVAQWAVDLTRTWEKKWGELGGTVYRLSAAEQKEFNDRVRPLGDQMLASNSKTAAMYKLLKAATVATRQK